MCIRSQPFNWLFPLRSKPCTHSISLRSLQFGSKLRFFWESLRGNIRGGQAVFVAFHYVPKKIMQSRVYKTTLRFALACTAPLVFVGTPQTSLHLFFLHCRSIAPHSVLLHPPKPQKCVRFTHVLFVWGSAAPYCLCSPLWGARLRPFAIKATALLVTSSCACFVWLGARC